MLSPGPNARSRTVAPGDKKPKGPESLGDAAPPPGPGKAAADEAPKTAEEAWPYTLVC